MEYNININQCGVVKTGLVDKLDLVDCSILHYIRGWIWRHGRNAAVICLHGRPYVWIHFRTLMDEMPLLHITCREALSRRLRKLEQLGLIKRFSDPGKRVYITTTELCETIYHSASVIDEVIDEVSHEVIDEVSVESTPLEPMTDDRVNSKRTPSTLLTSDSKVSKVVTGQSLPPPQEVTDESLQVVTDESPNHYKELTANNRSTVRSDVQVRNHKNTQVEASPQQEFDVSKVKTSVQPKKRKSAKKSATKSKSKFDKNDYELASWSIKRWSQSYETSKGKPYHTTYKKKDLEEIAAVIARLRRHKKLEINQFSSLFRQLWEVISDDYVTNGRWTGWALNVRTPKKLYKKDKSGVLYWDLLLDKLLGERENGKTKTSQNSGTVTSVFQKGDPAYYRRAAELNQKYEFLYHRQSPK